MRTFRKGTSLPALDHRSNTGSLETRLVAPCRGKRPGKCDELHLVELWSYWKIPIPSKIKDLLVPNMWNRSTKPGFLGSCLLSRGWDYAYFFKSIQLRYCQVPIQVGDQWGRKKWYIFLWTSFCALGCTFTPMSTCFDPCNLVSVFNFFL